MACHMNKFLPSTKQWALSKQFSTLRFLPEAADKVSGSKNSNQSSLHASATCKFPSVSPLPLPSNVQEINASEVGCFSPLRSRDISGSFISQHTAYEDISYSTNIDITVDSDPHIGPYDCRGAVSLSSSMQSNVPSPFGGGHCFLGMPGSQWGHGQKFLSEQLQSSHYLTMRNTYSRNIHGSAFKPGTIRLYFTGALPGIHDITSGSNLSHSPNLHMVLANRSNDRRMSSESTTPTPGEGDKPISRKQQLKQAVAAYGSTVIVFHVAISLASLGTSYLLVSSGLDINAWMEHFGLANTAFSQKMAANAGTFVVAYALHKVFAPVRIGITLTATPFIVRYLRKVGILTMPKKQV